MVFNRHKGRYRDNKFYENMLSLMQQDEQQQQVAMEQVLSRTIEKALRIPLFADKKEELSSIKDLDSLQCSGFYMEPDKILPRAEPNWPLLLDNEKIIFTAKTSASSGTPKIMPFTKDSLEHAGLGFSPFVAKQILELRRQGIEKTLLLALTASSDFVTYNAIPSVSVYAGMDIIHAPLTHIILQPEVAQELVDIILKEDIHCIGTVAPMIHPLLNALRRVKNGEKAIARMQETMKFGFYGGTEIYQHLERDLRQIFGPIINLFASTEYLVTAGSHGEEDCQTMFFNPNYCIPGIIPLEEIEKEQSGYTPKMCLWYEAPEGMIGEIVITTPMAIPWINARTSDYGMVVKDHGSYNAPAFKFYAKGSKILDIGGAKIFPGEIETPLNSLDDITDFLVQGVKGYEIDSNRDCLLTYIEGCASPEVIETVIRAHATELDFILEHNMADLEIQYVKPGTLQELRGKKSRKLGNAPGPLKHKVIKGKQYILN